MHIDLPALVATWGYPVTFLGALLEGEMVLTLAGLAVHRGHLNLVAVYLLAAFGGALGDTIYFALGRHYGLKFLARWPRLAPAVAKANRLAARSPALAIVAVRFLYGMRIAGPMVFGAGGMPWTRFVAWNALGALMWAAVWLAAGYVLGAAAERLVGDVGRIERELFVGVVVVAVVVLVALKLRRRRQPPEA